MQPFKVIVGLEDRGVHGTFAPAFKELYQAIRAALEAGTSWEALETTNFIEHTVEVAGSEQTIKFALDFYGARDLAYSVGLLIDKGDLVDPPPDIDPYAIEMAYLEAARGHIDGLLAGAEDVVTAGFQAMVILGQV